MQLYATVLILDDSSGDWAILIFFLHFDSDRDYEVYFMKIHYVQRNKYNMYFTYQLSFKCLVRTIIINKRKIRSMLSTSPKPGKNFN